MGEQAIYDRERFCRDSFSEPMAYAALRVSRRWMPELLTP
jgi:hypothetical protein